MRILTPLEVFQSHSPLDGKVKPTGHVAVNWTEAPDNPLVGKGLQIAGRRADGQLGRWAVGQLGSWADGTTDGIPSYRGVGWCSRAVPSGVVVCGVLPSG